MKILAVGDIVGESGVKKLKEQGYTQKKVAGIVKKSERTVNR